MARWQDAQRLSANTVALWLPPLGLVAGWWLAPDHLQLGAYISIIAIFAISLDLLLGYAGVITLGHAAYFGIGAYVVAILGVRGLSDPIVGLLLAMVISAAAGIIGGMLTCRISGLALIMLTFALNQVLHEIANRAKWLTGGSDGLNVSITPVLGLFRFDLFGRTAYIYCGVVLCLVAIFARWLVRTPFGRSLHAIRENPLRSSAIGISIEWRLIAISSISGALAGAAGALLTQTTQFVGLKVFSFELSAEVLIMVVLGGVAKIYGAIIGAAGYIIAQDLIARSDPVYWYLWIGIILVARVWLPALWRRLPPDLSFANILRLGRAG